MEATKLIVNVIFNVLGMAALIVVLLLGSIAIWDILRGK